MYLSAYTFAFILGGVFGFALACIFVANKTVEQMAENYRMRTELHSLRHSLATDAERYRKAA